MTKGTGTKVKVVKAPAKQAKRTALQEYVGGRSYAEIASAVGVCKSFVSRVLSGERSPSLDKAEQMAKTLGLSLDKFAEMRKQVHVT